MEIKHSWQEGRKLKTVSGMSKIESFIMPVRNDACNQIRDCFETSAADDYIFKKRAEGLKGFGVMHLMLAAYVRTVSQRPAINRFIRGQRIYARNNIEVAMTIKKEMKLDAPDTCIKLIFPPDATAEEIYYIVDKEIQAARSEKSDFDDVAHILGNLPRFILKFVVWLLNKMDYHRMLPRALTKLSPFHGSMIITSMGSLGIPPIYHHIYNFGNVPVFVSFGAKRSVVELDKNGAPVDKKYVDYCVVTDERICDGHYFASALKYMRTLFAKPEVLDQKPEKVIEDIR